MNARASLRLLIATGGSAHSLNAVRQAGRLAKLAPLDVSLLTVVHDEMERDKAGAALAQASAILAPDAVHLATQIQIGSVAEIIVAEAATGRYDVLIMGERASHSLTARLLGPTAQRVLTHISCPILIAKDTPHDVQRILACDGGQQAPTLLDRFVARLPQFLTAGVEVTVLHVMSQISAGPGVPGGQLRADAGELIASHAPEGELLEHDLATLADTGIRATPKIRHGLVVDEILAEAESGPYDLIVIGAHQGRGWRYLLDDLAQKVINRTRRSVLVVP